jgi:hypothetical protein
MRNALQALYQDAYIQWLMLENGMVNVRNRKGLLLQFTSNYFEKCYWVLQVSLKFFACRKNIIHFTAVQRLNYLYFFKFNLCEPDYSHLQWPSLHSTLGLYSNV